MQYSKVYFFLVFSCSFALREERRSRVFENNVPVIISRRIRWKENVARMGERERRGV